MSTFATDIDLLHWEPHIMTDAADVAQSMLAGSGTLSAQTLTIGAGSLIDAHVSNEHVIVLAGAVAGSFPIVSIDSATQLTLSVLYDDLYPDEGGGLPPPPGSGSGLPYTIRTFWPQRKNASDLLLEAAGVKVEDVAKILNPLVLRRPCVLATLQLVYSALAASAEDPANLLARANLYERLYRRAIRAAMVELDLNSDGVADTRRSLSVIELRRT